MKLVFLHGIGDGNVKNAWHAALADGLRGLGYATPDLNEVIAPDYATLLRLEPPPVCPTPDETTIALTAAEAGRERWEYERRQAAIEKLLQAAGKGGNAFSFPESLMECALNVPAFDLDQARRYVNNEGLRGCVLRTVLNELPTSGEIVIVGHSLGSLVAIDLLGHLPGELIVLGLITIGSPAGNVPMHGKKDRLLKKFPLSRVKTWVNLWSSRDPVPYGRAIAHLFPHALDVRIELGMCEHGADAYLRHCIVATAIGYAIYGSQCREPAPPETRVDIPLNEREQLLVAALAYGHLLGDEIKDPLRQDKFRAALAVVQQSLISGFTELCQNDGRPVPLRLATLADGRRPEAGPLFSVARAIFVFLEFATGNVIAPYEINTGQDERRRAFAALASFVGFREAVGINVFDALTVARKEIKEKGSILTPLIGLAAGGGLLLAAPLGLMMAAPAGLAGGAAIVAALAGFGPGGMIGGLMAAGGLVAAGGGTAGAAVKAIVSSSGEAVEHAVAQLLANAIARQKIGEPHDDRVWFALCELEAQIMRELQCVEPYSDADALSVKVLRRKLHAVSRAIEYMTKNKLAPPFPSAADITSPMHHRLPT